MIVIVTVIAAVELVAAAAAEPVAAEPVAAAVSDLLLVSHAVILRQNVAAAFVVAAEIVAFVVAELVAAEIVASFVVAAFAAASDLLMVPLVKMIHQLAVLAAATFVASVAAAFLAHPQAKPEYFVSKVTQIHLSRYGCKMRSTGEATEAWKQTLNF